MKKILFVITLLFMFSSCDEQCTVPAERCVPQVEYEIGLYVVEEKEYGTYMMADHRYLTLGDVKTHELRRVEIGKYSFDQINVGDTIEWKKERMK